MENFHADGSPMKELNFEDRFSNSAVFDAPLTRFQKREGTTQRGQEFEDFMAANVALELTLDQSVKDFCIGSNVKEYGAFDDLVLEVDFGKSEPSLYMVQIKHSDKHKTIPLEYFKSNKHFKISKYFEEFKKLPGKNSKKLVLCTNLTFSPSGGYIVDNVDGLELIMYKQEPERLFKQSDGNCLCYKFMINQVKITSSLVSEYEEFLNNFYLYTNHMNIEGIGEKICTELCNTFGCKEQSSKDYLDFIKKWSCQEGKKTKLTKTIIRHVLVLRLLSPSIRTLSFWPCLNTKKKLLGQAFLKFQVTLVVKQQAENLKVLWSNAANEGVNQTELEKLNRKYLVTSESKDNINPGNEMAYTKLFWLMEKCPLVVDDSQSTRKIIALCPKRKFVLLCNDITVPSSGFKVSVLTNLEDLNQFPQLYEECVTTFTYSIQGKQELPLKQLLKHTKDISRVITTTQLIEMCELLNIGQVEKLPTPHIERSLSRTVISFDILLKKLKRTILIISGVSSTDLMAKMQKNKDSPPRIQTDIKVTNIQSYWNYDQDHRVFVSEEECTQSEIRIVCRRVNKTKYHLFRFHQNGLEWLRSEGDLEDLQGYLLSEYDVSETEMLTYEQTNKIQLICADPGMGKTTLAKSLQNNSSPTFLTLSIFVRNYSNHFASADSFKARIVQEVGRQWGEFESKVLKTLLEQGHVRLIWDGLDEVSDQNLEIIINIIKEFAKAGSKQWITSRNTLRQRLEETFSVFSRSLKELTKLEQEHYMQEKLKYNTKDFDTVRDALHRFKHRDMLGIPLHVYILTELILQDPETLTRLSNGTFYTSELFELFVEEQFNIYKKEKHNGKESNDIVNKIIDGYKTYRIRDYEKIAMRLYFEERLLKDLNVEHEEVEDVVGILVKEPEDIFGKFFHNCFGAYFAASFLAKNFHKIPHFKEIFFEAKYDSIRLLFDSILAKDCPAHLAVLHHNMEMLEQCSNEALRKKDAAGRSPLHLACSWSTRYSILPVERKGTVAIVDDSAILDLPKPKIRDIVVFLANKCDPAEEEHLFKMNSFGYAYRSLNLGSLMVLSLVYNVKPRELTKNIETVLYYCVRFDDEAVLDILDRIPEVEVKNLGSLALLAVRYNSVKCLKKLLEKDVKREDFEVLLEEACTRRHDRIMELLVESSYVKVSRSCFDMELNKSLVC